MNILDYKMNVGRLVRILLVNLFMSVACPEMAVSLDTNGVYVQNGITTEVDINVPRRYEAITTNRPTILHFSNGLISRIETNSEFFVSSFYQDVLNTNSNAERAKFGQSTLSATLLSGTAIFVYPEDDTNSSCVISTPLSDIELHKGAFYFVVNENNILVLAIHGSLVAHGDKNETKTVSAGDALIAMPNKIGIFDAKISLSTQYIHEPVLNKLKDSTKEISNTKDSILFIRINGKTVGVSL